ncbi:MAG: TolC family protein [Bacteroidaceae bacterium]|nr:TolC family protein [Bacteroidaceae bacterium]MBR5158071.1 TolC family protein [Bacteroidaceae bacterium]
MRKPLAISVICCAWCLIGQAAGDEVMTLTLEEVIRMAQESSPNAVQARNTYESAYWSYRSYKASMRPSLSLSTRPSLNRSTSSVTLGDGSVQYARTNSMSNNLTLDLSQNLWFTGGTISLSSSVNRLDMLGQNHTTTYYSQPLQLSFSQDLSGYNSMKWERKTEPLYYKMARKQYAETMELVAANAVNYFFNLASAQTELEIATINLEAADTMYAFGLGRYNIGTITENELLQLELNKLNEETSIITTQMSFDEAADQLRNYLNLPSDARIEVVTSDSIPGFQVELQKALELAYENNPDMESMQLSRLNSESALARAKSQAGLRASVYVRLGLAQTGDDINESMHNLNDEQSISLTVSIPILDWGQGKGRVRVARNNLDLTNMRLEQQQLSFDRQVTRAVSQFNLQERRVEIAHRTMLTAQHRYEVARQLYMTGRSTVLDLNSAITSKDSAYRGYVSALSTWWQLYYTIRSMTGYDFQNDSLLEYQIEYGY